MNDALTIDALRHGQTTAGARFVGSNDVELTDLGWDQMLQSVAGDAMGGSPPWDLCVSSPLLRCRSFAEYLAERLAIPLAIDDRFREVHFGDWEGRTAADLMESSSVALGRFWADPVENTPPGGEPLFEFRARVVAGWEALQGSCSARRTLVITHGGVIRCLMCEINDSPLKDLLGWRVDLGTMHRLVGEAGPVVDPLTASSDWKVGERHLSRERLR